MKRRHPSKNKWLLPVAASTSAIAAVLTSTACAPKAQDPALVQAKAKIDQSFSVAAKEDGETSGTETAGGEQQPTATASEAAPVTEASPVAATVEIAVPAPVVAEKPDVQKATELSLHDRLIINKDALDKEFLLSASLIPQQGAPTSQGLNGRIVAFKKKGDKVFLMEATQGHVVTDELPSQLILAEIPIVGETDTKIEVDFNAGMKKVFLMDNWYGSDFSGKRYQSWMQSYNADLTNSFIESIGFKGNSLEIRQIVQLDTKELDGFLYEGPGPFGIGVTMNQYSLAPSYEVRYFLEPYKANPNFTSKETSDFTQIGFFEVPPTLETTSGRSSVKISKWDVSKPITYSVSANTPADFVDAVKDGVLYWNKAFGREVVKVDVAPKGVTAPDAEHNVIQWVPWDRAGFAYADALMDPRTGEIKNAQVYMTSAFTFGSKAKVRKLLRSLRATAAGVLSPSVTEDAATGKSGETKALMAQAKEVFGDLPTDILETQDTASLTGSKKGLSREERQVLMDSARQRLAGDITHADEHAAGKLAGKSLKVGFLKPTRMCDVDMTRQIEATLEAAIDANADDATILRISQDYVRTVIAHEVGHTLGMRHNFAGSLASPLNTQERVAAFNDYLLKGTKLDESKVLSSSVMDYLIFSDDVLIGASMQNASADRKAALAYDELAMQWAYGGKELPLKGTPLFCTDSGMSSFLDCNVFDAGAKPIEYNASYLRQTIRDLPKSFVEAYLSAKAPANPLDTVALEKIAVNADGVALSLAIELYMQTLWLDENWGRSLSVERQFDRVSYFNREEVLEKRYAWVKSQIADAGGVDGVYLSTYPICSTSNVMQSSTCAGYAAKIAEQITELDAYLAREDVRNFVGADGQKHSLTDAEVALIHERGLKFLDSFQKRMTFWTNVVFFFSQIGMPSTPAEVAGEPGSITAQFEARLPEIATGVMLAKKDKQTKSLEAEVNGFKSAVNAPDYRFDFATRIFVIPALLDGWFGGNTPGFAKDVAKGVAGQLGAEIAPVTLGRSLIQILPTQPRLTQKYLIEQGTLIYMMGGQL